MATATALQLPPPRTARPPSQPRHLYPASLSNTARSQRTFTDADFHTPRSHLASGGSQRSSSSRRRPQPVEHITIVGQGTSGLGDKCRNELINLRKAKFKEWRQAKRSAKEQEESERAQAPPQHAPMSPYHAERQQHMERMREHERSVEKMITQNLKSKQTLKQEVERAKKESQEWLKEYTSHIEYRHQRQQQSPAPLPQQQQQDQQQQPGQQQQQQQQGPSAGTPITRSRSPQEQELSESRRRDFCEVKEAEARIKKEVEEINEAEYRRRLASRERVREMRTNVHELVLHSVEDKQAAVRAQRAGIRSAQKERRDNHDTFVQLLRDTNKEWSEKRRSDLSSSRRNHEENIVKDLMRRKKEQDKFDNAVLGWRKQVEADQLKTVHERTRHNLKEPQKALHRIQQQKQQVITDMIAKRKTLLGELDKERREQQKSKRKQHDEIKTWEASAKTTPRSTHAAGNNGGSARLSGSAGTGGDGTGGGTAEHDDDAHAFREIV